MTAEPDPKGQRGGDTGNADQVGKGKHAEKGDQYRDEPTHSGPTRSPRADDERQTESDS